MPGSPDLSWSKFYATDLKENYEKTGSLTDSIDRTAGVYFWKLRLRPDCHWGDTHALQEHLERITELPQGRLGRVPLSRGVSIEGLRMGGSGLSTDKLTGLRELCQSSTQARWLIKFLTDLEDRTPALYCGEAGDIPHRLAEHLAGRTGFGREVENDSELEWSDLLVEIISTDSEPSEEKKRSATAHRRSIEHLGTLMTASMFTKRAG